MKPGDVLLFDRVRQRLNSRKEVFLDQKADKGHAIVMLFLGTVPLFARKVDPKGMDRLRALGWMPQTEALLPLKKALQEDYTREELEELPVSAGLKLLLLEAWES